ncbi:LPPG:FO 2-phospho-L-lactate transferase [Panacagrimonas perspica]|uniref:LPPG:FO 2-phospho-L-lactate transferase n=1 Tax=Panacagrimonas perspica TaxID=381431 RepID=A0A4R7PCF0_9GAMM|nr:2-phospho-L-lactate transferase [Panacagrimonas perspica]TDU31794.1 LPPG:FO 2-phospho-L-lactate transferase [Panacagrimonas perspica]THD02998.1 2-phospho-L-lactate transferase [Panacagrimonas perspica]
MTSSPRVLALSGGVGGARLAAGLARVLAPEALTIAVNVGDDFEHLGLTICPDLDTVLYTLGGVVHRGQGWGRDQETWHTLDAMRSLGGEDWFLLGDRDLALHLVRRQLLAQGRSLSEVTQDLSRRLDVSHRIVPVTDARLRTRVHTVADGELGFQDYFVRRRCQPAVRALTFEGAEEATLSPGLAEVLADPALSAIIVCPSNPYLSVAPMLAIPALRTALRVTHAPVIAVSPIIGGEAVKGPTAKIMRELGVEPTATVIAELYADFVDCVVVDTCDASRVAGDPRFAVAPTWMRNDDDRFALAQACLDLARQRKG